MSDILDQSISETSIQLTANSVRILQLDIFRAFAIFGIFMVNILVMNVSFVYRGEWLTEAASTLNNIIDWYLQFFFFSKFFPVFSFLFGIGVALQIRSLKSKLIPSSAFLIRRFTALLVFGISHILFIWSGDILHLYALFGFLLIIFALQTKVGFKLLSPLQYVGRMAFTNYILHNVSNIGKAQVSEKDADLAKNVIQQLEDWLPNNNRV